MPPTLSPEDQPAVATARGRISPAPAPDPVALGLRRELGLPTDRPVVMSGHQAEFWHPGIVAKIFALGHADQRAATAWTVVDTDENDPTQVRYPSRALRASAWSLEPKNSHPGVPTGKRPPIDARSLTPPEDAPRGPIREGLVRIADGLHRAGPAGSLAEQCTIAAFSLLPEHQRPQTVLSSLLARTTLFAELVDAMRRDPLACARAYNAAAAGQPDARLRPLHIAPDGASAELPLWSVAPGRPRRRVVMPAGGDPPGPSELAPKALLLTALLRRGACDLFIHGTGGERYDRAMEAWLRAWDPAPLRGGTLAPSITVSGTLRLDGSAFDHAAPIPTHERIDAAVARAHSAAHAPRLLGDAHAQREKDEDLRAISEASTKALKGTAYMAMHRRLAAWRERRHPELEALASEARRLHALRGVAGVVHDRTYPFPLYGEDALRGLRAEVERVVGALPRS